MKGETYFFTQPSSDCEEMPFTIRRHNYLSVMEIISSVFIPEAPFIENITHIQAGNL